MRRIAVAALFALAATIGLPGAANADIPEIAIVPGSTINLVSRESSAPISIKNEFDADIRVFVKVSPSNARVEVPRVVEVTVPALTTLNAEVPVRAVAQGKVFLRVQLTTFSGLPLGKSMVLQMNVDPDLETNLVVGFGLLVTALGAWGTVRTVRKRREREAEAANAEAAR
jgi:hypothetical protein